ncbi:zinc ribbon domain-containing protein [Okeania sp. SIO1I7]
MRSIPEESFAERKCSECGFEADRDFNAAINLKNYVHQ